MKDEYDFSGGTRGKFFRKNARTKLPYHRGSQSWLVDVATTGKWWQPEFWREPAYRESSPWDVERVEAAFRALTKLYTEADAKAALAWVLAQDPVERAQRRAGALWKLLACPLRPDLSPLLRLGLDIVDSGLSVHSKLAHVLKSEEFPAWNSARFELRCLAAFRNAGLEILGEPSQGDDRSSDITLRIGDRAVCIDVQHAEEGEWAKEEQGWLWKLLTGLTGRTETSAERSIHAHVRLTPKFRMFQQSVEGRSYLRAHIDRLAEAIATTKIRLADHSVRFPAEELIDDLIEVKVMGPPGSAGGGGSILGVSTDARREVARVVSGAVARGAARLPSGAPGLVLLDPGMHAPSHLLVEEVKRWMAQEGAGYTDLAGVLVMAEVLVEPVPSVMGRLEQIVPVWRDDAPRWLIEGPWDALSDALSARGRDVLEYRCARASSEWPTDGLLGAAVG